MNKAKKRCNIVSYSFKLMCAVFLFDNNNRQWDIYSR